jgi:transposase InsO family protein
MTDGRRWGVEPICSDLKIAPSTYYDTKSRPPSARAIRDAEFGPALVDLWKHNYSVYGRRKLTKAARRAGHDVGRDQVARLMRNQGIRGASRSKKRFTTKSDPAALRAPDLVNRNFTASRPDALWVTDFTYCPTWSGIVYVAFVIDVLSRRLVGWKAARTMTTPLVLDALNMAAWTRRHTTLDGLVCHSDAGSNTRQFSTPSVSKTSVLRRPSAPSGTATTTPWPNRSWGSSRPSCTATPLPWPKTAVPGRASTTSRSPSAPGSRGSTRSGCTQNSGT